MRCTHTPRNQELFDSLYVGAVEIARRCKVNRNTVQYWIALGRFPAPDAVAGATMLWSRVDIEPYIRGYEIAAKQKQDTQLIIEDAA
jgi:hypothetical protein